MKINFPLGTKSILSDNILGFEDNTVISLPCLSIFPCSKSNLLNINCSSNLNFKSES